MSSLLNSIIITIKVDSQKSSKTSKQLSLLLLPNLSLDLQPEKMAIIPKDQGKNNNIDLKISRYQDHGV
jgi:hypothetical protein